MCTVIWPDWPWPSPPLDPPAPPPAPAPSERIDETPVFDYVPNSLPALRLVQGDAVYRPGRAAHRFSERDAVRHGSRPRDDIRVVHPVAVAVEGAVVDYDGAV